MLAGSVCSVLPYGLDRWLAPRLPGRWGVLVFPAALVTVSMLAAAGNPFGTWGDLGYSQLPFLPLARAASLAGLPGLSLLMGLGASALNDARARAGRGLSAWAPALIWAGVTAAIVAWGAGGSAAIVARGAGGSAAGGERRATFAALYPRHGEPSAIEACRHDDLACLSTRARAAEAQLVADSWAASAAGARVILWSEGAVLVPAGDEAALTARLGALAAAEGVYLIAGLAVVPERPGPWVNQLVAFRPDGGVAWSYQKARPVPGEPIAAGDGRVRVLDTPYGRLAALICFDADFPELARQVGRADADVLLIAANDWPAIADAHADMARLRGVETGASIVRATGHGVSLAADRDGRVLARGDDASAPFLLAEVPLRGGATPYARAGDVVGWAAAGLLALALLGVAGRGAAGVAGRALARAQAVLGLAARGGLERPGRDEG